MFLGDAWDPVREIDTYPPSTGALALYEKVSRSLQADVLIVPDREYLNYANVNLDSHIYYRRNSIKCLMTPLLHLIKWKQLQ